MNLLKMKGKTMKNEIEASAYVHEEVKPEAHQRLSWLALL
tara:strand:- start:36 stop:155 length:120 start_codon:yes stop_codon:yes gene_type:complete